MPFKLGQGPWPLSNEPLRAESAMHAGGSNLWGLSSWYVREHGGIELSDMMPSLRSSSMENSGCAVTRAPVIMVWGGSPQILNAVLYSQNTCWVVDASVVADNADLDNAHDSKYVK